MGTSARSLITNLSAEEIIDDLDRLYSYQMSVFLWLRAVATRLEGAALLYLGSELEEEAATSLSAAQRLADRIAELGGEVTSHPRDLVDRAGIPSFDIPGDTSSPKTILGYALVELQRMVPFIDELARKTRFDDPVTYQLVVDLLTAAVTREDEIEAVIGAAAPSPAA